jgi:hypothetical protein
MVPLALPAHVRTELALFALVMGIMMCISSVMLVNGVRCKFYNKGRSRSFRSAKRLRLKDFLLLEMMQSRDSSYSVTDPADVDNPIVFSSDGFCRMTQYTVDEVEGRNCRFLQGAATSLGDVDCIRKAVAARWYDHFTLLNYKKVEPPFENSFFLCPLFDDDYNLVYFVGIQVEAGCSDEESFYANLLFAYYQKS